MEIDSFASGERPEKHLVLRRRWRQISLEALGLCIRGLPTLCPLDSITFSRIN